MDVSSFIKSLKHSANATPTPSAFSAVTTTIALADSDEDIEEDEEEVGEEVGEEEEDYTSLNIFHSTTGRRRRAWASEASNGRTEGVDYAPLQIMQANALPSSTTHTRSQRATALLSAAQHHLAARSGAGSKRQREVDIRGLQQALLTQQRLLGDLHSGEKHTGLPTSRPSGPVVPMRSSTLVRSGQKESEPNTLQFVEELLGNLDNSDEVPRTVEEEHHIPSSGHIASDGEAKGRVAPNLSTKEEGKRSDGVLDMSAVSSAPPLPPSTGAATPPAPAKKMSFFAKAKQLAKGK